MKVMELAWMALNALKAEAQKLGHENAGALIERAVAELHKLPWSYHDLEVSSENADAAKEGAQAARAHASQLSMQASQLDEHISGAGPQAPQRGVIAAHEDAKSEAPGEDQISHAEAVAKSKELARAEQSPADQIKDFVERNAEAHRAKARA